MKPSSKAIRFIGSELKIPTGPKAGKPLKLAPYAKEFIRGALLTEVSIAVLSIARGDGKSTYAAALAVAELFGMFTEQPRREILIAAGKRDQAEVAWTYALALIRSMPDNFRERIKVRYPEWR